MKVGFKSHSGKRRKNNEDRILVDTDKGIFLLADGMGGHQAGEVASDLAVNQCYAFLEENLKQIEVEADIDKFLIEALFRVHDVIKEKAKIDIDLMGMGTTLVEMVIKKDTAYVCHVGDSRVYLIRDGIRQITRDHTVGDYLVEHNIMKREEVSPQKWHTLTQAVGSSGTLFPELNKFSLKDGDLLLLCSDGLTDMLVDAEIEEILKQNKENIDKAVKTLVTQANKKGGRDNISVVLVEYE